MYVFIFLGKEDNFDVLKKFLVISGIALTMSPTTPPPPTPLSLPTSPRPCHNCTSTGCIITT